jgi:hypothetical protein
MAGKPERRPDPGRTARSRPLRATVHAARAITRVKITVDA